MLLEPSLSLPEAELDMWDQDVC